MFKKLSLSVTAFCVLLTLISASSCSKQPEQKRVKIETEYGDMIVELYDQTPKHKENFLHLVDSGFYNDLLFHRVIKQFMIQGGDPESKNAAPGQMLGNGGPGYTVPAEFNDSLFHKKGALAAARQGDQVNPTKASSGSQFYIVQGKTYTIEELQQMEQQLNEQRYSEYRNKVLMQPQHNHLAQEIMEAMNTQNQQEYNRILGQIDSLVHDAFPNIPPFKFTQKQIDIYTTVGGVPHLDGNYTVFGEVVEGLDVIDKIAAVQTDANDRPSKDIKMKATLIE